MKKLIVIATLIAAGAARAQSPDPSEVFLIGTTYGGNGCPAGTLNEARLEGADAIVVDADLMIASAGPGVPISENRKTCLRSIHLHVPGGWSYSVAQVDFRGHVMLADRVEATQKVVYSFRGQVAQATAQTSFKGPKDEDYLVRDTLGLESLVWSPCGGDSSLTVNTQIRVNNARNRQGSGSITAEPSDDEAAQRFALLWRRCR